MKKKVLLIPMLAGVMLAASCSKDDGTAVVDEIVVPNETPEAVAEQPAAQSLISLVVREPLLPPSRRTFRRTKKL